MIHFAICLKLTQFVSQLYFNKIKQKKKKKHWWTKCLKHISLPPIIYKNYQKRILKRKHKAKKTHKLNRKGDNNRILMAGKQMDRW